MPRFDVYATVTGSKYLGEFEADTAKEAEDLADVSQAAYISLCHQCSEECEDPEVTSVTASPVP